MKRLISVVLSFALVLSLLGNLGIYANAESTDVPEEPAATDPDTSEDADTSEDPDNSDDPNTPTDPDAGLSPAADPIQITEVTLLNVPKPW